MSQTVVVTGASGFLAKRIIVDLLHAGHRVRGTLRTPARADEVKAAVTPELGDVALLERLTFAQVDLERDAGWSEAMAGCDALVHTASPFPIASPKSDDEVIRPAVDGTLRALRAARAEGIERVILTSSTQAVLGVPEPARVTPYTEADWTDADSPATTAYNRSKTLAERAAWNFVETEGDGMALTAINPGWILGRPLDEHFGSSASLVVRMLRGKDPMVPDMGVTIADIEDVSLAHVRALERPETAGRRFIIAADTALALVEWCRILKEAYPQRRIAKRVAPKFLLRVLALFDREIAESLRYIGVHPRVSTTAARDALGVSPRASRDALLGTAEFVVSRGLV